MGGVFAAWTHAGQRPGLRPLWSRNRPGLGAALAGFVNSTDSLSKPPSGFVGKLLPPFFSRSPSRLLKRISAPR